MSKRNSAGDVNVSPMSDRGGGSSGTTATSGSGFGYLQPAASNKQPPRGGVEVVLDLPPTVTRRAPPGKRSLTPRGNPFVGAATKAVVQVKPAGQNPRTEQLSGPTMLEREPIFGAASGSAVASPVSPIQKSPSAGTGGRRPSPRSSSGNRKASPRARKSIPADHVDLSSVLSSIQGRKSSPTTVTDSSPTASAPKEQSGEEDRASTRASRSSTFLHVKRGTSLCLQLTGVVMLSAVLLLGAIALAAPLFIRFNSPEDLLVRDYVPTVSQLQGIYQEPAYGLNASETRCLYLRVLEDRQDALDRSLSMHALTSDDPTLVTDEQKVLRLEQIARAHHMLRHRVRLYARSRDDSSWNQHIFYPLRDAFVYGVLRHGWVDTVRALFWSPNLSDWGARIYDTTVCSRQSEHIPCPSLALVKEKAAKALRKQQRTNAGAGAEKSTLEQAKEMSAYIINRSAKSNSWYNDQFCSDLFKQRKQKG